MINAKQTKSDIAFNITNAVILTLLSAMMLYPLIYVLGHSAMTDAERAARPFAMFPRDADWSAYKTIFGPGSYILNAYKVTVLRVVIGTAFNLFFTAMFAYVLSKKEYPMRVPFTLFVVFTMWFGGGLIPTFLLIRSLGLIDSFWVYVFPILISPYNMLIMRNFFMAIPDSLEESAKLDGAHEMTIFIRIILPLSVASLATIGLFYAVRHWNSWFDALIYINTRSKWVLQVFLREVIQNSSTMDMLEPSADMENLPPAEQVKMATIVVSTLPILFVYPFIQKHFVKGVMIGSLKG